MGKSCGSFSGAAESEQTATLREGAGVERKGGGPAWRSLAWEGFRALFRPGRCWPRPSAGRTVPREATALLETAWCLLGPHVSSALPVPWRNFHNRDSLEMALKERKKRKREREKTTQNKTTASELAP